MKPVVIVGAGLAGLTCARTLKRHGVPFFVIDADDRVGGRLKTDVIGHLKLDRGHQVYFTGYPHAKDQIDLERLKLQKFEGGAYVVWDGELHLISRDKPVQTVLSSLLSLTDKLKLAKWTSDVQWIDWDEIDEVPDRSTEQYLRDEGFSDQFIERFARPFFGAAFLDRTLGTSCRRLIFLWKVMADGETTVPEGGMESIPKQIASTFGSDVLKLNTAAAEVVIDNGRAIGVKTANGDFIEADRVVLACDAYHSAELAKTKFAVSFTDSITLYFSSDQEPVPGSWLVLNGNMRGITSHVVPVFPGEGDEGKHLMSATIIGDRPETDQQLADIVKSEMRLWFPDHDVENWELLRCDRAKNAKMAEPPGFQKLLPGNESGVPGLYFAGEFTRNSSIDGAIQSGLDCAQLILSRTAAIA